MCSFHPLINLVIDSTQGHSEGLEWYLGWYLMTKLILILSTLGCARYFGTHNVRGKEQRLTEEIILKCIFCIICFLILLLMDATVPCFVEIER